MPIPLHLRRQIGASRTSPSSVGVPEPTPVVDAPKAAATPSFTVSPWVRQAKAAAASAPAAEEPAAPAAAFIRLRRLRRFRTASFGFTLDSFRKPRPRAPMLEAFWRLRLSHPPLPPQPNPW